MGFMTGVVTGIAVAAGAAAWYLSRSGSRFRDQYRVEDRLAELGDEMERRTRDLQASVNAQLTDLRSKQGATNDRLDAAAATAAEAEAAVASAAEPDADTETTVTKARKAAKSTD
jgi:hypothetical protein